MESSKKSVARNAALTVFALLACSGLIFLGRQFDLQKSDWAGWVQAVGSIAAIGVAIFVMSWQNKNAVRLIHHADELQVERRARVAGIIFGDLRNPAEHFAFSMLEDYHAARPTPEEPDLIAAQRSALSRHIDSLSIDKTWYHNPLRTLDSIPIYELGSERLVDIIYVFKNGLKRFAAALNAAGSDQERFDPKTLHDAAALWLSISAQAKINFDKEFARRYGSSANSDRECHSSHHHQMWHPN